MSTIAIQVTAPGGSPADITSDCIFTECSFQQQMNAVAGRFSVKVRDPDQTHSFVTGSEISLEVDGILLFGGYVTSVEMGSMAPAADTSNLAGYDLRTWTLQGPDYNIIFDKRVWRDDSDPPDSYLTAIDLSSSVTDGAILREAIDNYADLSDFDSSGIEDIADIPTGDVLQQGDTLRKEFESLSLFGGAVWYIDPSKAFTYKPYDDVVKRWGFSDTPNRNPITASPDEYQGATYPFREVTGTEDASYMVNDALIWGGSQFAGAGGGTVFARETDATSVSDHHRWQTGETHFGERLYSIQDQVDARAAVIVNGPPGADATGQQKGLKNPQWQFTFTWTSANVPLLSGTPDHIIPGDILNIELAVFGTTTLLPLRELRISFPDAFVNDGTHLVVFTGTFGLQLSDPFSLWRYLLTQRKGITVQVPSLVSNASTGTSYGAWYTGEPSPATDGSETVFAIPFGFITSSTQVYVDGLFKTLGTDYTESDPDNGEITFAAPPASGTVIIVLALTLET